MPVRPRVQAPESGESLPLADVVRSLLADRPVGVVEVVGDARTGKTTALAHLAEQLAQDTDVVLLDEPDLDDLEQLGHRRPIVFTSRCPHRKLCDVSLRLNPWAQDDLIEYLLAEHPTACRDVMQRVRDAGDGHLTQGNPELWRLVLDRMAANTALDSIRESLWAVIERFGPRAADRERAGRACLAEFGIGATLDRRSFRDLDQMVFEEQWHLLHHRTIRVMLAAEELMEGLRDQQVLVEMLPRDVIQEAAVQLVSQPEAIRYLTGLMRGRRNNFQPLVASLLVASGSDWRPTTWQPPNLSRALLAGASWVGVCLSGGDLYRANLSDADLSKSNLARSSLDGASLDRAKLVRADLQHARLCTARLVLAEAAEAVAMGVDLARADLRGSNWQSADLRVATMIGADLREASFAHANLTGADLVDARVRGADFRNAVMVDANLSRLVLRHASLEAAVLNGAVLREADLEDVELPEPALQHADLTAALLTGSRLRGAQMNGANLQNAGLADIDWEAADLRGADFRNATFHMGSSRSGLVGSPYPGHGSRTGFYTDDFDQQHFKPPEEIRKANLCRADLRGATVTETDFYLVDLRGAYYDRRQAVHFRRCGAIL